MLYCNTVTVAATRHAGAGLGAQALGWARGRWAERAGAGQACRPAQGAGGAQAGGRSAGGRAERRRAGGAQAAAARPRRAAGVELAAGAGVGARGLGLPVRAGWACWLVSWAKLVHCAPGSVLTQFLTRIDSVFS